MTNSSIKGMAAAAGLALATLASPASASVTVVDQYFGGANFYNDPNDVIGSSTFDTSSAVFERFGAGANSLRVTINTNYAGAPEANISLGTGYGALFLTPGYNVWSPQGPGPGYHTDTYQPGDWAYAVTMPFLGGGSGVTGLYSVTEANIGMSHVGGSYSGTNFRNNQAVEYFPTASALRTASWAVAPGKVTFEINDNHLLGDNFAFSWAMTCANDVIQGQVTGVPEPTAWALMILGFGGVGAAVRRRRGVLAV